MYSKSKLDSNYILNLLTAKVARYSMKHWSLHTLKKTMILKICEMILKSLIKITLF